MPKPIKKKVKSHIKFRTGAKLKRKGETRNDSIKRAPFQPLRDTGAGFRVKIKRKSD